MPAFRSMLRELARQALHVVAGQPVAARVRRKAPLDPQPATPRALAREVVLALLGQPSPRSSSRRPRR